MNVFILSCLLLLGNVSVAHGKLGKRFGNKKRCRWVVCPAITCAPDHISFIPSGRCCPVCKPALDCSAVLCAACADDEVSVIVDGECCPLCEPQNLTDCSLVRCAQPVCSDGYEPVKEGCCETCNLKSNCEIVQCITAPCPPICVDEPKSVEEVCPQLKCQSGYEPSTLEGESCPTCKLVDDQTLPPCIMAACLDPCFTYSTENDETAPMCDPDQQCVTEIVYTHGGGDHCPATGCPHFVECI